MADSPKSVAELIEINLMFAQLELSIGRDDPDASARALDHIMEALAELRKTMPAKDEAEVLRTQENTSNPLESSGGF